MNVKNYRMGLYVEVNVAGVDEADARNRVSAALREAADADQGGNVTIAEKMLELLDSKEKWGKGRLRDYGGSYLRRCALGARLDAERGELALIGDNETALVALENDPVIQGLAAIIWEQYPDAMKGRDLRRDSSVIMTFNDLIATKYADIRAVIEKGIARGL